MLIQDTKYVAQQYEERIKAQATMKKKDIIINNFLGGLAWGLGTVVGATVVVAAVGWLLNSVGWFDPVKYFFDQFQPPHFS